MMVIDGGREGVGIRFLGYPAAGTGNPGDSHTLSELMRIQSDGRVGINTTTPDYKLTVKGSVTISSVSFTGGGLNDMTLSEADLTGSDVNVRIQVDSVGATDTFEWSIDGGSTWAGTGVAMTDYAQDIDYWSGSQTLYVYVYFNATTGHTLGNHWDFTVTNSVDPFKILDSQNNLLIGGDNSGNIYFAQKNATIDRWGEFTGLGVYAEHYLGIYDSSGNYVTAFKGGTQTKDLTYTWPNSYPGATTTLRSTSSGVLTWSSSSARFKDNIKNLNDDWSKILQVQPRSFTYKSDGSADIGYIAEEFDALGLKDLVGYDKDGLPWNIQYDKVAVYDTEILKIHQKDIDNISLILDTTGLLNATSTSATSTQDFVDNHPGFVETIRQILAKLGVSIQNGVASITSIVTQNLEIGSAQKPSGFTLYDQATAQPYCVGIVNGEFVKTAGECGSVPTNAPTASVAVSTPTPAVASTLPPSMISLTELPAGSSATSTETVAGSATPAAPAAPATTENNSQPANELTSTSVPAGTAAVPVASSDTGHSSVQQ